jgi:hypothetical protein
VTNYVQTLRARANEPNAKPAPFRDELARARDAATRDSETGTATARQRARSPAR